MVPERNERLQAQQTVLVLSLAFVAVLLAIAVVLQLVHNTTTGTRANVVTPSAASSGPATVTPTAPTATPAGPTQTPVPATATPSRTFSGTFSGSGNGQTGSFLEYGGRWTIQWSCSGGTRLTVLLQQQDQTQVIIKSGCPNSGMMALVRQAAAYNLQVNSDATWTLTIQPS